MNENDMKKEKKYVVLQYDAATQEYLRQYCIDNGFDLTTTFSGDTQDFADFKFHTTIFYTTTLHNIPNQSAAFNVTDIVPTNFALFGDNILVLEIKSDIIEAIRAAFIAEHNMQDKWDTYRPHITLSYKHTSLPTIGLPTALPLIGTGIAIERQIN